LEIRIFSTVQLICIADMFHCYCDAVPLCDVIRSIFAEMLQDDFIVCIHTIFYENLSVSSDIHGQKHVHDTFKSIFPCKLHKVH